MPARALMIQGCTSDSGKSVLVAGLCRMLARRGVAVAPFKPQNMALNSAVTAGRGEIGRAQALQAQACFLAPHTDMNPVLLKPSSDTTAQVIIHGQALRPMDAAAYHDYKRIAREAVLESFARLCGRYQIIVVEGAGSPAEINLRDNDIANMGFAEAVDCPVILIADIDRGGVFAHLVGTLQLLSASERDRVCGFVINKFRGDLALLQPGLEWLERQTGKPVLGVLPYLRDFHLDAEDAINPAQADTGTGGGPALKVSVPVFSRISNHTDFDALRLHPQVDLQYVAPGRRIPHCDLIVLPGSKNVRHDLHGLREHGWDRAVKKHLRYGGKVIGICGGYQMLGREIADPDGVEDRAGQSDGLGLLDVATELTPRKKLENVRAVLNLDDAEVTGYYIHCGVTTHDGPRRPLLQGADGRNDGVISADNQIIGTHLHGLFDHPQAARALLGWAGLRKPREFDRDAVRELQLERLADCVEAQMNCDKLFAGYPGTVAA